MLSCISMMMYLCAPVKYSQIYIFFCFLCYFFTYLNFILIKKDKNFFNFHFIFTVVFTFVYFLYPLLIFPINKNRFFMFNNQFNEDVINKSTALALLGYQFFILGYLSYKKKCSRKKYFIYGTISNFIPTLLLFVTVVLHYVQVFVFKAGLLYGYDGNADPTASSIWGYFTVIKSGIIFTSISIEFYNLFHKGIVKKWFKYNIFLWFSLLCEIICIVSTGSRGLALQIILMVFAGIAILYGGINLKQILVLFLLGFISLSFIVVARSGGAFTFSFNILDMGMDLIINNYTLYVGYDYVQQNGCVLFSLLGSLLSAIPLLQGFVVRLFNISIFNTSSARFFSFLVLGDNPEFGVGTNIISALYLAGGLLAVITLMFVLGKFIAYISDDVFYCSIYKLAIYFSMMGYSVYFVRADYFYPVGKIVFTLVFIFIFTSIYIFKYKVRDNNSI